MSAYESYQKALGLLDPTERAAMEHDNTKKYGAALNEHWQEDVTNTYTKYVPQTWYGTGKLIVNKDVDDVQQDDLDVANSGFMKTEQSFDFGANMTKMSSPIDSFNKTDLTYTQFTPHDEFQKLLHYANTVGQMGNQVIGGNLNAGQYLQYNVFTAMPTMIWGMISGSSTEQEDQQDATWDIYKKKYDEAATQWDKNKTIVQNAQSQWDSYKQSIPHLQDVWDESKANMDAVIKTNSTKWQNSYDDAVTYLSKKVDNVILQPSPQESQQDFENQYNLYLAMKNKKLKVSALQSYNMHENQIDQQQVETQNKYQQAQYDYQNATNDLNNFKSSNPTNPYNTTNMYSQLPPRPDEKQLGDRPDQDKLIGQRPDFEKDIGKDPSQAQDLKAADISQTVLEAPLGPLGPVKALAGIIDLIPGTNHWAEGAVDTIARAPGALVDDIIGLF